MKKITAAFGLLLCNICMSKYNPHLSRHAERKAEKELDAFLRQLSGPAIDIMAELRALS